MPMRYGPLVFILILVLTSSSPVLAQEQRFELGGGAGFSWPSSPDLALKRGWDLGGFIGIRFNDNFSLETDFSYSKSNRQFIEELFPGDDPSAELSDFELQTTRSHLDSVLVIHLGRRHPFHPFVFGGAGVLREDRKITDVTPLREVDPQDIGDIELEITTDSEYHPVLTVGTGFNFYIFHNIATRFEYRLWTTKEWGRHTQRLFFTAVYFF